MGLNIRDLLILAHNDGYDILSLAGTLNDVFARQTLVPIEGRPGTFREMESGRIVDIRNF